MALLSSDNSCCLDRDASVVQMAATAQLVMVSLILLLSLAMVGFGTFFKSMRNSMVAEGWGQRLTEWADAEGGNSGETESMFAMRQNAMHDEVGSSNGGGGAELGDIELLEVGQRTDRWQARGGLRVVDEEEEGEREVREDEGEEAGSR